MLVNIERGPHWPAANESDRLVSCDMLFIASKFSILTILTLLVRLIDKCKHGQWLCLFPVSQCHRGNIVLTCPSCSKSFEVNGDPVLITGTNRNYCYSILSPFMCSLSWCIHGIVEPPLYIYYFIEILSELAFLAPHRNTNMLNKV